MPAARAATENISILLLSYATISFISLSFTLSLMILLIHADIADAIAPIFAAD
jgi:hypothetical protein